MLGGIIVTFAAAAAFAQTTPHYLAVTYMKTLPGKAEAFRKFAETDMLKMGQAGIDEGILDAYYVTRLTAPYTTGSDYDYAQVIWYKNRPSLAGPDRAVWEARAKKAGFANYQLYLDKRDSLVKSVRSAWRTATFRIGDIQVGSYMRTANWQVEPEYRPDTLRFIEEYTMPLSKARMAGGSLQGWGMTRPAAVTGSEDEAGYSFSISNVLKDSDTMLAGPGALTEEVFKKAIPGKSYAAYLSESNRLLAHRKVVMTRISEVVALAGKPPTVTP
jgi:hypothetical protein